MSEPVAFNPCLTEECKTRCDSYGVYCEDICIKEIERKDAAIAELVALLKDARRDEYGSIYYVVHLLDAVIAKYDTPNGPDFEDGCSLEGFVGGCERMGCHD